MKSLVLSLTAAPLLQLREIQGQLGDRAHKHKEMPTAILDIDVNTVDEFQVKSLKLKQFCEEGSSIVYTY